ncbi:MAG: cell envelope integrity protein TolA [Deltaproteobacteria bacterium]|nr:cell envelope integrity protein TolA [Deltaproteobacteria bacterium]
MRKSIPLIGLCFIFCLVGLAKPAGAQDEAIIVAVFDMEDKGSGLDAKVMVNLTDYLAVLLTEAGYQIIPRDQIRARLKQQKNESHKACHDQSCQVEMGRELAAQKSLSTQIFKIGKKCQLTATFFDLRKAAADKAVRVKADCTEESLGEALEPLVLKLTGKKVDVEKAGLAKAAEERRKQKEAELAAATAAKLKAENEGKAKEEEKAEVDRKAKEKEQAEADRKAKEKAEVERQVAEKAKAEQLEQAVKSSQEKEPEAKDEFKTWAFRLRVGLLMPSFDEAVYFMETDNNDFGTDIGIYGGMEMSWRPLRYFALGLFLDMAHQNEPEDDGDDYFTKMGLGLRLWGFLPVGSSFELRLGVGLGAGVLIEGHAGEVDLREDPGLRMDGQLGAAYALTDWFSLTADFGVMFLMGAAGTEGEEFDIGPLLFLTLGTEFNF